MHIEPNPIPSLITNIDRRGKMKNKRCMRKKTSGWHLLEERFEGPRGVCAGRAVWPCNYGQTSGPEGTGRRGSYEEPYNLAGTAPCLLV